MHSCTVGLYHSDPPQPSWEEDMTLGISKQQENLITPLPSLHSYHRHPHSTFLQFLSQVLKLVLLLTLGSTRYSRSHFSPVQNGFHQKRLQDYLMMVSTQFCELIKDGNIVIERHHNFHKFLSFYRLGVGKQGFQKTKTIMKILAS